jgi:hypothetical protein
MIFAFVRMRMDGAAVLACKTRAADRLATKADDPAMATRRTPTSS